MSLGCNVGARTYSTWAWKAGPLIGPTRSTGAIMPFCLSAPTKVAAPVASIRTKRSNA